MAVVALLVMVAGCGRAPDSTSTSAAPAEVLRVELDENGAGPVKKFDVIGLTSDELSVFAALSSERVTDVLRVSVANGADATDIPAMAGLASVAGSALRFTPRYPLSYGLRYRVAIDRAALAPTGSFDSDLVVVDFTTPPRPPTPPTTITRVYPTSDELPENQLKFYIHFSAPMSRGEAYQRIHLLDGQGQELEHVFLELGEELWDPEMRRFTLLCDPARVKRGLVPREELGPVLTAGREYKLVIDREWQDATGRPLEAAAGKRFHAVAVDETPIDVKQWRIEPPLAGTNDSLIVKFPEPLDHSLLLRMLNVETATKKTIAGIVEVGCDETCWQLSPDRPWVPGEYQLVVNTALEDLAGNAVGRPFDVDKFGPIQVSVDSETVAVPFTIEPR